MPAYNKIHALLWKHCFKRVQLTKQARLNQRSTGVVTYHILFEQQKVIPVPLHNIHPQSDFIEHEAIVTFLYPVLPR